MGLAFVVILLSNDALAQRTEPSLHSKTLYEAVKQTSGLDRNSQIDVGDSPVTININELSTNTVYVANTDSDSISVISGENNTWIKDIPVGRSPGAIAVNHNTNTVYVTNTDSNSVSIIDGTANKVVAGVTFRVNPFNSGYILCDGLTTPSLIEQYIYVYSGDECIAKPNEGFEFVSWGENLKDNSTQLITLFNPSSTIFEDISNSFYNLVNYLGFNIFFGIHKSVEPESILTVNKFGTFTANFKQLPPPIPNEYLIGLYTIVATTIIGWSIPSIIGWIKSNKEIRKLSYYHNNIKALYNDGKLDENDIEPLNKIRNDISDAYSRGKINSEHYSSLKEEISILFQDLFKKRIESLNAILNNKNKEKEVKQIKNNLSDAYSKGKLTELHYNLLQEKISEFENKDNDNENKT